MLPGEMIEYYGVGPRGKRRLTGFQVGRFVVSRADGCHFSSRDGRHGITLEWMVVHVSSGIAIIDADSFEEASFVADEVSRFSACDPDAGLADESRLVSQLGPMMLGWLKAIADVDDARELPFREWRAQQQAGGWA